MTADVHKHLNGFLNNGSTMTPKHALNQTPKHNLHTPKHLPSQTPKRARKPPAETIEVKAEKESAFKSLFNPIKDFFSSTPKHKANDNVNSGNAIVIKKNNTNNSNNNNNNSSFNNNNNNNNNNSGSKKQTANNRNRFYETLFWHKLFFYNFYP
jgi:hypothetical protein